MLTDKKDSPLDVHSDPQFMLPKRRVESLSQLNELLLASKKSEAAKPGIIDRVQCFQPLLKKAFKDLVILYEKLAHVDPDDFLLHKLASLTVLAEALEKHLQGAPQDESATSAQKDALKWLKNLISLGYHLERLRKFEEYFTSDAENQQAQDDSTIDPSNPNAPSITEIMTSLQYFHDQRENLDALKLDLSAFTNLARYLNRLTDPTHQVIIDWFYTVIMSPKSLSFIDDSQKIKFENFRDQLNRCTHASRQDPDFLLAYLAYIRPLHEKNDPNEPFTQSNSSYYFQRLSKLVREHVDMRGGYTNISQEDNNNIDWLATKSCGNSIRKLKVTAFVFRDQFMGQEINKKPLFPLNRQSPKAHNTPEGLSF